MIRIKIKIKIVTINDDTGNNNNNNNNNDMNDNNNDYIIFVYQCILLRVMPVVITLPLILLVSCWYDNLLENSWYMYNHFPSPPNDA